MSSLEVTHIVEKSVWRWMCGRVCFLEKLPLRKVDSVSMSSELKPHLFCFPPLCPWWSLALAFCLWELWIKCRTLNGEITACRQTQLAFKWHFFPKRLKAGNKQVGQLWVSVNVLTPSRGVNQRRAWPATGSLQQGAASPPGLKSK